MTGQLLATLWWLFVLGVIGFLMFLCIVGKILIRMKALNISIFALLLPTFVSAVTIGISLHAHQIKNSLSKLQIGLLLLFYSLTILAWLVFLCFTLRKGPDEKRKRLDNNLSRSRYLDQDGPRSSL